MIFMKAITYILLLSIFTISVGIFVKIFQANDRSIQTTAPTSAIEDEFINQMYGQRSWLDSGELAFDPIQVGKGADIPVEDVRAKIIGASYDDSVSSLAAKIWLIDHAKHSVDAGYYIFRGDVVGKAFLGALCQAVQRGVDVRMLVDSFGAIHPIHPSLKAFEQCGKNGGYLKNDQGQLTTKRARSQAVIFNAISKVFVNHNRRAHDKLLIVDGAFPGKAWVMTGGEI